MYLSPEMPRYNINNVDIIFPYEAYDCQLDFMKSCINAIQEVKDILIRGKMLFWRAQP